ncbi:metalloprotease [Marasmius crinis-equi]|uniref:Metalloprotease n=1 Tax=Marasmius crinis-equi TaxID=585013 RepID=A0ABR3F7J9_9AGAR
MTIDTSNPSWRRVTPARDNVPPFSVFTKPIEKSQQDDREYRIIKLQNGLEATLVHDATADKAAASLDVAVGHLSDPDDMPGLAHFCEHLLFMGTENFPKENEYSEYLAKNNGSSNAYTSLSNTNYYFSVSTSHLSGALARFSSFFHCPLFAPSCTSRELNAVDSEHKKNHQQDLWRIFQVNKHLSKPGHPFSKFGSGNRESLSRKAQELKAKGKLPPGSSLTAEVQKLQVDPSPISSRVASPAPSDISTSSEGDSDGGAAGRETRRRLIEWWQKEYCAGRMKLCVVGKESLDDLSELVSTLFSPILNRGIEPLPTIADHPFGPNEKGTLISIPTIMTMHMLEIAFPLDPQVENWRHKPANFISHLIGHEGPGSLLSLLKKEGLAVGLSCGPQALGRGFDMLRVTLELTGKGFENYQQVILLTTKYFNLLRSQSQFEHFHQHEISALSLTRFRFLEKRKPDGYATHIAETMSKPYPRELLLAAPNITWDWGDEYPGYEKHGNGEVKLRELINSLRMEEGRVLLMGKEEELERVPRFDKSVEWKQEPWYGTKYRVERFPEDFLRSCSEGPASADLFLPGPNQFIPEDLSVEKKEVTQPQKRPHYIWSTPLCSMWHKKDDRFWAPKAEVTIHIRSRFSDTTARSTVLTRLYTDLITESLTEFAYDAELAGLKYDCHSSSKGLYVVLRGYNDKMGVLAEKVLERVKSLRVDGERLKVVIERNKKAWENFFMSQSYGIANFFASYVLSERAWRVEELLKELSSVTPCEIEEHAVKLLSQTHINMLIVGNVTEDEAVNIAEMAERGLGQLENDTEPSDLNEFALVLPPGSNYIYASQLLNPAQPNNALTYYLHFGPMNDSQLRVVSALLTQIMTEPAFNILRTKEQLGYIVHCSGLLLPGSTLKGVRIIVQSEKRAGYLEGRVEAFLEGVKDTLEQMSDAEFGEHKEGLRKKWLEDYKNLSEESSGYYSSINSGSWDFYRKENDAQAIQSVTKAEVVDCFMKYVHPSSPARAKLSVHMLSQKTPAKKVSPAAAKAFDALVRERDLGVNGASITPFSEENPAVLEFAAYWAGVLKVAGIKEEEAQAILKEIPAFVEKYPSEGDQGLTDEVRAGATYIKDEELKDFKKRLARSEKYPPAVVWHDQRVSPVSRL